MSSQILIDPIIDARESFNDRVAETEAYFSFLHNVLSGDTGIQIPAELRYTLTSVGYLVLYNLVESTSRVYLKLIHQSMICERIALEETTDLIRNVVLDGFRKNKPSAAFISSLSDLKTQIMSECYDEDTFFSGNVDAKLLRKIAAKYGFSAPKSCYGLLEIKNKRNDLAHGKKSFVECSKHEAEETIVKFKESIIKYLSTLSDSIELFVKNKNYKKTT